jgi:alpha-glucosidase (family GH31 glycosyl hydrolase)
MPGYGQEMRVISRRDTLLALGGAAVYLPNRVIGDASSSLTVGGIRVDLALTALTSTILRLSLVPARPDRAAIAELNNDPVLALSSQGRLLMKDQSVGSSRVLIWGNRRVRVAASPITFEIEDKTGYLIQSLRVDDQGTVTFKSSSGPVFGLGEGGPQFDRRGQEYTMENGQLAPFLATIGARLPIPCLISTDGWALFFHEPFGVLDLSRPEYVFSQSPTAVENPVPLDIFLVASQEPAEIMKAYAQITGFPHMPPLWAIGYQQSHRTLSSSDEILKEAKKFREDDLPCDTMIYLGTGFCPSGWNTGHGSFTFNNKVFPDPKQIIQELHNEHFHVVLHVTKPPQHLHGRVADAGAAAEDFSDAAHYWATHLDVFRLGVDGWWPDEGDPLPAEARLARNRMYWEGPIKDRPDKRPFALHRNGYAGMQRYGWLWSGDVDCTWKTLQAQIPVGLNTGLTGLPFWGTDTGGFVPTKELTGELYVRWFQFSAFCPLFRSHGRMWKLRLPWGWNTGELGPLEVDASRLPDKSELHNSQVEPICKKYLDLRYRLLPYTYSAVRAAHDTGLPLMRALWLHYPADPKAVGVSDEYLWGRDMLICPVTQPGAASKQVYLPEDVWYDFWTGERTEGGRILDRLVDLATMPIYVRGGAVLPLGPVKQFVNEKSDEPITLRVHPGASGESSIYADDGESFAYEHGEYLQLSLKWNDARRQLTIESGRGSKRVWPEFNNIQVELPRGGVLKRIKFGGKPVVLQL